jgi:RimJ/RimL family protein N-acetyltransferase
VKTATEVTRWVVNHAFTQLDMHRVSLIVLADNLRAISAYQTVYGNRLNHTSTISSYFRGFVEEGRVREANYQDGKWWDIVNMGILAREWKPNE